MSETEPSPPSFAELGLAEPLVKALEEVGYEAPSRIQAAAIPSLLSGRDLIGQAQTGTGKTAAFALPLLQRLDLGDLRPQVLVLTPTRELAIQVAEAFQRYAHHLPGFHVLPIYGGQAYPLQLRPLKRGVHVVVGTPGRVLDHLERGTLQLDALKALVLDEADEMLNMGFLEDVERVLEKAPAERQLALFSATLPPAVKRIADGYLRDPAHVALEVRVTAAETVRQRYWIVRPERKLDALTLLLEVEPYEAMIVFVRTKNAAVEVAEKLDARGHAAAPLNGDIPQEHRERTVDRLRRGRLDVIVATDVAARGLDVERVSHVINFDAPHDTESYVHRIGRTGRAGRTGEAVIFLAPRERRLLRVMERALGRAPEPLELPGTEEINAQRRERLARKLIEGMDDEALKPFEDLLRRLVEEKQLDPVRLAAAGALLAQGEQPLELPARRMPETAGHFEGRPERADRPDRAERPGRPEREHRGDDGRFARFRADAGKVHGLRPGDLVGAITNESTLTGADIGRIDLFPIFSVIDLPADLPDELVQALADVKVRGRRLGLRRLSEEEIARLPRRGGGPGPGKGGGHKPFRKDAPRGRSDRAWRPGGSPPERRERPGGEGASERSRDGGPGRPQHERPRERRDDEPAGGARKARRPAPPKGKKKHRKGAGPGKPPKGTKRGPSKPPWFR